MYQYIIPLINLRNYASIVILSGKFGILHKKNIEEYLRFANTHQIPLNIIFGSNNDSLQNCVQYPFSIQILKRRLNQTKLGNYEGIILYITGHSEYHKEKKPLCSITDQNQRHLTPESLIQISNPIKNLTFCIFDFCGSGQFGEAISKERRIISITASDKNRDSAGNSFPIQLFKCLTYATEQIDLLHAFNFTKNTDQNTQRGLNTPQFYSNGTDY